MQVKSTRSGCFKGNSRSRPTGSDDDGAFGVVLPHGGIVLEQVLAGGDKMRSGVKCTARPTADPDGMALRCFGDGRVWMDTCRMMPLSGAGDRPGKVGASVPALEMDRCKTAAATSKSASDRYVTQSRHCGLAGASGFKC